MAGNDLISVDVEELADLELTGQELRFVMAYLSPQCNFDSKKALRVVTPDDEFMSLKKATFYARARAMMNKQPVKDAISRLLSKEVEQKKNEIMPVLVDNLLLAATYDPAEIIDDDGDFRYGDLKSVPLKLRQTAIEGVSVKYWGKDCNVRTREVKLTSKSKARSDLLNIMKFYAQLDNQQEEDKTPHFTLNIGSANIEGMPSAKDLFSMANDMENDVEDIMEEEEEYDSEV